MRAAAPKRTPTRVRRDAIINLRVPAETRDLLDAAADAEGKTRTQFVVDSARIHATDVLLDRRIFKLDQAAFEKFCAALDEPAVPNRKLKELLSRKSPWEA